MRAINKLPLAAVLLIISIVLVSVSSYAWFSMNRVVAAEGIELSVTSPSNMLIKGSADEEFAGVGTALPPAHGMFPASTVDGVNFFALENGQYLGEDGVAKENTIFKDVSGIYVGYDDDEGYYADFEFIVKGMGGNDANVAVELLTVTTEEGSSLDRTIRVAVFEKNGEALTLKDFHAADGAAVNAIKSINEAKRISETSTDFAECDGYFLVRGDGSETIIVVRVWIEGQHTACNSSNLKSSVNIHIVFSIPD